MEISIPARSARSYRTTIRAVVGQVTPRRGFQLALGLIWLVDAALQYQPYMFTKAFVTEALAPTAGGNPMVISHPITWASNIMVHHIVVYNAIFASIQLVIAVGLFLRPTVKLALAISIPWAIGVWWFGEGLGGVLTGGVNPFTGAPGAVILYAFIALLVWPRPETVDGDLAGRSVATSSVLGGTVSRVLTLSLWASFVYFMLEPVNRNQTSLGTMVSGMDDGEPGWLRSMDHTLGNAISGNGTVIAFVFVALFLAAGLGLFVPRLVRPAVIVGVAVGLAIWVLEDFGEIFTGQGTDVNSGLLIVLLTAMFWPIGAPRASQILDAPNQPAL